MDAIRLLIFALYVWICYSTANYHFKRRNIDLLLSTILCVLVSPFIGGFILVQFPAKPRKDSLKENMPQRNSTARINKRVNWKKRLHDLKTLVYNLYDKLWDKNGTRAFTKSVILILSFCIITLILTNPTYSKFKEFTPDYSNREHFVLRTRIHNYLIYSVYEKSIVQYDEENYSQSLISSQQYIGILLNFYIKK
ncbi:MAG: hypothetical protein JST81_13295 [Bacteroidetes bacterium]|nr:hypothetical protein [Bacteroidota bacterium]